MIDLLYIVVFVLFQISFLLQLYYTFVIHKRLSNYKVSDEINPVINPVSIIICARNEQENLQKNLPLILEQEYPDFEVVLVNDCSVDDSHLVLRELASKYKHLKVVTINEHERFKHGKKFAVTLGIKAADNEHLLFTDADCRPFSALWLKRMQQNFSDDIEIVLGYSPYQRLNGFVNRLIRFETFYTALNYLAFTLQGTPYMGIGRNMAYKKSLFFRGKGFAAHMHILSGDDDLFVNQNATPNNTVIEIHPESHILSEPKKTFSEYFTQKLRHLGAGKAYKKSHQTMLTVQASSAIGFYLLLIGLIILQAQWYLILSVYIIRMSVLLIIYRPVFKKLACPDLIFWLPVFDFIYYIYILALSIVTLFKKKVKWK
ncbi:MAG TPA: glycosyltransferase [Sphingobacteriaceae bacterium]|nr:glycosyltransferase [Sphingobacteriaceae bacterium]